MDDHRDYRDLFDAIHEPPTNEAWPWDDRHPAWHRPPPDDPDWPPPATTHDSALVLRRLPLRAKVICGRVAGCMVRDMYARRAAIYGLDTSGVDEAVRGCHRLAAGDRVGTPQREEWYTQATSAGFDVRWAACEQLGLENVDPHPASPDDRRLVLLACAASEAATAIGFAARGNQAGVEAAIDRMLLAHFLHRVANTGADARPIRTMVYQGINVNDPLIAASLADWWRRCRAVLAISRIESARIA